MNGFFRACSTLFLSSFFGESLVLFAMRIILSGANAVVISASACPCSYGVSFPLVISFLPCFPPMYPIVPAVLSFDITGIAAVGSIGVINSEIAFVPMILAL